MTWTTAQCVCCERVIYAYFINDGCADCAACHVDDPCRGSVNKLNERRMSEGFPAIAPQEFYAHYYASQSEMRQERDAAPNPTAPNPGVKIGY